MTGDDLIVAVPWLAFAAGLAVIGWRLAAGRGHRRRTPQDRRDRSVAQNDQHRDGKGMETPMWRSRRRD